MTVTERCNLRCAHCITGHRNARGPGRARRSQPWLLDALAPSRSRTPTTSRSRTVANRSCRDDFHDVLRAIARARATRPGRADVHLITNGMLLDEARVSELADLGVTSLMVSLDGATAATNDRIRVLGKRDTVVANLARGRRAACTPRPRSAYRHLDRGRGGERQRSCPHSAGSPARLGVDWLKVEETYPATPFARRDALAPTAPAVVDAMAALRDVLAGSTLVLVDHLAPPAGCVCSGDPDVLAFRAADDFANRATFRPCRAAWEQAAIDPDGTVHAVDYAGPALGNLLDAPMLALWNAPPIVALRESAMAARACRRPSCRAGRPNG